MGMLRMRYSNQQGVTLVEVLVSMFLLGIAVIGFVALQVRALSVTSESSYRSQAMSIAQDLSERMRANYGKIAKYRTTYGWQKKLRHPHYLMAMLRQESVAVQPISVCMFLGVQLQHRMEAKQMRVQQIQALMWVLLSV